MVVKHGGSDRSLRGRTAPIPARVHGRHLPRRIIHRLRRPLQRRVPRQPCLRPESTCSGRVDRDFLAGSERAEGLRVGKSGCSVYAPVAIFSDIKTAKFDFHTGDYIQEEEDDKEDDGGACRATLATPMRTFGEPMRVMFDTGAAIHVCPVWFGENCPRAETTQEVTSAAGGGIKVCGRWALPVMFKERPRCCSMATFLVCDATTPILPSPSLFSRDLSARWKRATLIDALVSSSRFQMRSTGQRFLIVPTMFCDGRAEHPGLVPPPYSGKHAVASPAFARSSMRIVPGGNIG